MKNITEPQEVRLQVDHRWSDTRGTRIKQTIGCERNHLYLVVNQTRLICCSRSISVYLVLKPMLLSLPNQY